MTDPDCIVRVMRAALGTALLATAGTLAMCAQSARPELRFEVASVKRSDPASPNGTVTGGPGTSSPGRFTARNVYLFGLAMRAYGLDQMFKVEGKLPWMMEERYEVIANVPPGTTKEEFQLMLQRLLQERLGLVARRETRQMRGYRLVVAKDGARLTKSGGKPDNSSDEPGVVVKGGVAEFSKYAPSGELMTLDSRGSPQITLRGRSETMEWLAGRLSSRLKVPVMDATSVEGRYDFSITYAATPDVLGPPTGRPVMQGPAPPAPESAEAAAPSSLPSLWEAIEKQLGLKLEQVRSVPVDVLVLEKANKVPSEN